MIFLPGLLICGWHVFLLLSFFAPLGSYVIQFLPRRRVAQFLSVVLMIQYIGAMLVLRPPMLMTAFSLALIFVPFLVSCGCRVREIRFNAA